MHKTLKFYACTKSFIISKKGVYRIPKTILFHTTTSDLLKTQLQYPQKKKKKLNKEATKHTQNINWKILVKFYSLNRCLCLVSGLLMNTIRCRFNFLYLSTRQHSVFQELKDSHSINYKFSVINFIYITSSVV